MTVCDQGHLSWKITWKTERNQIFQIKAGKKNHLEDRLNVSVCNTIFTGERVNEPVDLISEKNMWNCPIILKERVLGFKQNNGF